MDFRRAGYYSGIVHEAGVCLDDSDLGHLARAVISYVHEHSGGLVPSACGWNCLPNRPQLAACLTTADDWALLVKRSAGVAIASSNWHTSIVGGIRPDKGDCDGHLPIPVAAIYRQGHEELGLDEEDFAQCRLAVLAQDNERLQQPILAFHVTTGLTADELVTRIQEKARTNGKLTSTCQSGLSQTFSITLGRCRCPPSGRSRL